MRVEFRIMSPLLAAIRADLHRPHPFAHERVGFISAGLSAMGRDLLVLARGYRPVPDGDYVDDPGVGAMMSREAIRAALEWSMREGHAMFHVHTHGGRGVPGFSGIDLREYRKFVPDFFKVAPQFAHGALVLSDDAARGQMWLSRRAEPVAINGFREVGSALRAWRAA